MTDNVNHPPHYNQLSYECWEVSSHFFMTGDLQNVWKYLYRYRSKGDPEVNLKKCVWYLDKVIWRTREPLPDYSDVHRVMIEYDKDSGNYEIRRSKRFQIVDDISNDLENNSHYEAHVAASMKILLVYCLEGGDDLNKLIAIKRVLNGRESQKYMIDTMNESFEESLDKHVIQMKGDNE